MVLEIKKNNGPFKTKQIWFADLPCDVDGVDRVIFRDCKNKVKAQGFSVEKFLTLVIDLKENIEEIWGNFDKSSCRYAIKKAQRDGIQIKINQGRDSFYKMNKAFKKNKNLPLSSSDSLKFLKNFGTLFTAYYQDKIIGGCIFLEDKDNIRWLIGSSVRLSVDKKEASLVGNANRLIIWEAIKYAKIKNIKEFDFGGYRPDEAGGLEKRQISIFKKSFGGKVVDRYVYQKEYSKIYRNLSLLKQVFKK